MGIRLYTQEEVERIFKPPLLLKEVKAIKSRASVPPPWRFAYRHPGMTITTVIFYHPLGNWLVHRSGNGRKLILSNNEIMAFEVVAGVKK